MEVRYSTPSSHQLTQTNSGRRAARARQRLGLTVMELCVVLAILALAAVVAIPLATRARENARSTRCRENLKSLYSAINNYESAHGFYPSNGWGYRWVGEPGRAAGVAQPGSWVYAILPHMEVPGWELTEVTAPGVPGCEDSLAQPVPQLHCPSRFANVLAPQTPTAAPWNVLWTPLVFRTDYASNEGDFHIRTGTGPRSLEEGDSGLYKWSSNALATGLIYYRSQVRRQDITDGLSCTYLLGEKYVPFMNYTNSFNDGYDQSMFTAADLDTNRCTSHPPIADSILLSGLLHGGARYFGSAHPRHCAMLMADGAVGSISFAIHRTTHSRQGNRADGASDGQLRTANLAGPVMPR